LKTVQETINTCDVRTQIVNLSGYRFVTLEDLPILQADLKAALAQTGVMGTVLLASEGINVAIAGTRQQTQAARAVLDEDSRFRDLWLKESFCETCPFSKLKVRVRHEIISFDGPPAKSPKVRPEAPSLAPEQVHQWLSENRDFVLLDTRNDYEIASGTFESAINLDLRHFRHFKKAVNEALDSGQLQLDKPMVTFCTGGIRCEKAAPWLLEQGFAEVYQIEGGILNYLEKCGDEHWQGDCFVFDERIEVDTKLVPTGVGWCNDCNRAVQFEQVCVCQNNGENNPDANA